jgi:CcmD family protein
MKSRNLTAMPLAAAVLPESSGSYGWVLFANLVIWGGIALYFLMLGRRASRLDRR